MKIKLDENLPGRLVALLEDLGHDVDTVPMEEIAGRSDDVVWGAARSEGRFLITQDLYFSDVREFAPGTHDGILVVRLRQPGRDALVTSVFDFFKSDVKSDLVGCFIVLTERKVRVRRPKNGPGEHS